MFFFRLRQSGINSVVRILLKLLMSRRGYQKSKSILPLRQGDSIPRSTRLQIEQGMQLHERMQMIKEETIIKAFGLKRILDLDATDTQIMQPVSTITWDSLRNFQQLAIKCTTTVAIKADGVRALVHSDMNGKCTALTCEWDYLHSKWTWVQKDLGQAKKHYGFLLGAELVYAAGKPLYLCHDVHRWLLSPRVTDEDLLLTSRALGVFIEELGIPALAWKPQHPITACIDVLQRHYPYPTDGLIFTQRKIPHEFPLSALARLTLSDQTQSVTVDCRTSFVVWKWKPTECITFDFVLGNSSPCPQGLQFSLLVSGEEENQLFRGPALPSFLIFDLKPPLFTRDRVVEVRWDGELGRWKFVRFRPDKQVANKSIIVSQLLDIIDAPLSIEKVMSTVNADANVGHARDQVESDFRGLYGYHKAIKRRLFSLFGTSPALDLCCGRLSDLHSYANAGLLLVVAVDRDEAALVTARSRIDQESARLAPALPPCSVCLVQCDLSTPDLLASKIADVGYGSAFCNFGIHYFFSCNEHTNNFLSNVVPLLVDDAYFVVTYMEGTAVRAVVPLVVKTTTSSCITSSNVAASDDHDVDFSLTLCDDAVDVFFRSIGRHHIESIVDSDVLKERFTDAGLECNAIFTFQEIGSLLGHDLSEKEQTVSDLYRVGVFRKKAPQAAPPKASKAFPLLDQLLIVRIILPYLQIRDLVRFRSVSVELHRMVDHVRLLENHEAYLFGAVKTRLKSCSLLKRNLSSIRFCDGDLKHTIRYIQQIFALDSEAAAYTLSFGSLYDRSPEQSDSDNSERYGPQSYYGQRGDSDDDDYVGYYRSDSDNDDYGYRSHFGYGHYRGRYY